MTEKVNKKVKFLAAVIGSLLITSVSAFGMYGRGDSWINFLTDGNQFRARMDQLGFTLGNGTIKGTFGFRASEIDLGNVGNIISGNNNIKLDSTISAGIGYTSEAFGIGVGYNYTYVHNVKKLDAIVDVHTPVLMINALNNNLRIVAPIQVSVEERDLAAGVKAKYTGVAFDNIQLRYFTGIDAFNAVRLYFYYRNSSTKINTQDEETVLAAETFGFQARFYFLNTQIGNVTVNPFLKVAYHTALKGGTIKGYEAETFSSPILVKDIDGKYKQSDSYEANPYEVNVAAVLSLAASSDIVSFYFEPSLGYTANYKGRIKNEADNKVDHKLAWGAYAELYVTPVKDLEWYFEMDVNNGDIDQPVSFASTTGITWYLPSFGGDTAQ